MVVPTIVARTTYPDAEIRGRLRLWKEKLAQQYRHFERARTDPARRPVGTTCCRCAPTRCSATSMRINNSLSALGRVGLSAGGQSGRICHWVSRRS